MSASTRKPTICKTDTFLDQLGNVTTPSMQCASALPEVDILFTAGVRKIPVPPKVAGVVTFIERVQIMLDAQMNWADNVLLSAQLTTMLRDAQQSLGRQ